MTASFGNVPALWRIYSLQNMEWKIHMHLTSTEFCKKLFILITLCSGQGSSTGKYPINHRSSYGNERGKGILGASKGVWFAFVFLKWSSSTGNYELVFTFWTVRFLTGCQGCYSNKLYALVTTWVENFHLRKNDTSAIAFQGDNCTSQVVKKKIIYK